jgi:hypothetical protein
MQNKLAFMHAIYRTMAIVAASATVALMSAGATRAADFPNQPVEMSLRSLLLAFLDSQSR